TAVSKVCDLEIARTGLLERQAHAVGLRFVTVTVEATNRAGYYPGVTAGMTVERMTALDLGYAPPFSPVWDPVLVAARKAAGAVRDAGA
ncbi:flavoprotein oxidoreductase, partial [Streptomyces platensis subsp. clarensis]|nr:flavoprotein oxidoreductase [Streptomyces platensis subsp. clarensis]